MKTKHELSKWVQKMSNGNKKNKKHASRKLSYFYLRLINFVYAMIEQVAYQY